MEPECIAQTSEPVTVAERRQWFRDTAADMRNQGATFFIYSFHPEQREIILVEGWKLAPDAQGEPRFQLTIAE